MNNIKLTCFIAWRNLWRNKRRTFISVFGLAFGLMLYLMMISIGDGAYLNIIESAVSLESGYITIEHPDYALKPAIKLTVDDREILSAQLNKIKNISRVKQLIQGQAMLRSSHNTIGVKLQGIIPSQEAPTADTAKKIIAGSYLEDTDKNKLVLSQKFAKRLKAGVGSKLVITVNDKNGDLSEQLFRVKGIFNTGSPEIDLAIVQIPLQSSQKLYALQEDQVTRLGLMLYDPDNRDHIIKYVQDTTQHRYAVRTWEQVIPELYQYIQTDRFGNFVFSGVLLFLILFTVLNTILMSVIERKIEFATVLALGTMPSMLRIQIMLESFLIACLGCTIGALLGYLAYLPLHVYGINLAVAVPEEGIQVAGASMPLVIYAQLKLSTAMKMIFSVLVAATAMGIIPMFKSTRVSLTERGQ